MAAGSRVERMLEAKNRLPLRRKQIFEAIYQRGCDKATAARDLGMSTEEMDREHGAMLRSLRGAAATA